jgi:sugar phosphate isomerase/epimerase
MSESRKGIGYSIPNDEDYGLLKLGPALDEAAGHGVDYVELPLYALELVANGRILRDRLRRVKTLTEGRPFGYTMHGPLGLNLMERPEALALHKDVLKATLEITAELGGVHYVAHGGTKLADDEANAEARFAQQREVLAEMGAFAADHGITIAVENLFGGAERATLPSRLAQEIAAIGHPAVRACLDFSHAFLLSTYRGADFPDEAAALAPYAKHLHVHDSFGKLAGRFGYRAERLAYGAGDLHLPLGLGSIPWDALTERCRFPEGVIFINELAPPYWTDLAETLQRTREIAANAKIGEGPASG